MKGSPRSSNIPAWELPGVQAIRNAPPETPQLGLDWAAAVFCTFGAPPALVLAGLLHAGGSPVVFWVLACGSFFAGLALSLRLRPLPPRRVLAVETGKEVPKMLPRPGWPQTIELGVEAELPGVAPDLSRADLLEQLAKLREQGDLSNREYESAVRRLLGE